MNVIVIIDTRMERSFIYVVINTGVHETLQPIGLLLNSPMHTCTCTTYNMHTYHVKGEQEQKAVRV